FVRDYRHRSIGLEPHDTPRVVLTAELPPLIVECVAVAVIRVRAHRADVPVVFEPPQLTVIGNVAPHQTPGVAVPRRSFRPAAADIKPLDHGVIDLEMESLLVDDYDIRIGVADRVFPRPVALRLRGERSERSSAQSGLQHRPTCRNQGHESKYIARCRSV